MLGNSSEHQTQTIGNEDVFNPLKMNHGFGYDENDNEDVSLFDN